MELIYYFKNPDEEYYFKITNEQFVKALATFKNVDNNEELFEYYYDDLLKYYRDEAEERYNNEQAEKNNPYKYYGLDENEFH